jgi:hypothetical protein
LPIKVNFSRNKNAAKRVKINILKNEASFNKILPVSNKFFSENRKNFIKRSNKKGFSLLKISYIKAYKEDFLSSSFSISPYLSYDYNYKKTNEYENTYDKYSNDDKDDNKNENISHRIKNNNNLHSNIKDEISNNLHPNPNPKLKIKTNNFTNTNPNKNTIKLKKNMTTNNININIDDECVIKDRFLKLKIKKKFVYEKMKMQKLNKVYNQTIMNNININVNEHYDEEVEENKKESYSMSISKEKKKRNSIYKDFSKKMENNMFYNNNLNLYEGYLKSFLTTKKLDNIKETKNKLLKKETRK